jgi:prepilin-type N-terminal cleavage/methylation domain-containing protein
MRFGTPRRLGNQRAFSLVELLVVIGILVLLVAVLLPALSRVRHASRSTVCLSNLRQWGQAFQMYVNNNHGNSLPNLQLPPNSRYWWQYLSQYNGDVQRTLLCPEATELGYGGPDHTDGSATQAWHFSNFVGSYGINQWVLAHAFPNYPGGMGQRHIRLAGAKSEVIPLLADCCWPWNEPLTSDAVPTNLQYPEVGSNGLMRMYCIDRHNVGVNMVFLDDHAERVQLADLWKLKWSEGSRPRDVSVPKL